MQAAESKFFILEVVLQFRLVLGQLRFLFLLEAVKASRNTQLKKYDFLIVLQQYLASSSSEHVQLFDLIERMLEYDVTKRITLDEAIKHPFFDSIRKTKK